MLPKLPSLRACAFVHPLVCVHLRRPHQLIMRAARCVQVCRTLREKYAVRCPIIAMTGQTSSKDLQRYYAMGFDVVLPKPFTRDAIGRALVEARER